MSGSATISETHPVRDCMTTDEFRQWFDRLGLGETELALRLEVKQPTINRWRSGARTPPGFLWRALEHLEAELDRERRPKRRRASGEKTVVRAAVSGDH